ncbi:MAG: FmdB family zinc ribbon protein [Nitriliruptoraceae bacterium]
MPTYEYACRACGEHLEVVQSFRDDPLTECPACSGQLRKVFSAAGIIFKGSGWHSKDYATNRSGSSGGSSEGSSSSSSDGSSKDSSSGSDGGSGSSGTGSSGSGSSSTSAKPSAESA